MEVVFINPGYKHDNPTGPFWSNLSAFMQASAKQFDITLEIQYSGRDHLLMKRQILKTIAQQPDYVVLVNEKGAAEQFFPLLAKADIKVLFLLNPPNQSIRLAKSPFWVANLVPDHFQAGYQLAISLHQQAKTSHNKSSFNLLAIHGDNATQASRLRKQGLMEYLKQVKGQIKLLDHINGNWSQAQAYQRSQAYFSRLKHVDMVWAANDPMAYGAYMALQEHQPQDIKHTKFGGINWDYAQNDPQQLPHLISLGGHMTLGAFAMAVIYDHYQLQKQQGIELKLNTFSEATTPSAKLLTRLIKLKQLERLDYTKFSQSKHPAPKSMTLDNLAHTYHK